MADKLNAVLTIEDNTLEKLKQAQEQLTAMNTAADGLATKLSSVASSAKEMAFAMNGISFSGGITDMSKIEAGFQSVINVVSKLGDAISGTLGSNSESSRAAVTQESLVARLEATWGKAAGTYAQITARIKELKGFIDGMATLSVGGQIITPESTTAIQKASETIKILEERLKSLGLAFDGTRAQSKVAESIGLSDSDYESAIAKLKALKDARKEVMLPGGEENAGAKNSMLSQLDDAVTKLSAKLPELKAQARELKDAIKVDNATNRLNSALDLPNNTVDEMKNKVAAIKKAMTELESLSRKRTDAGLSSIVDTSKLEDARRSVEMLKMAIKEAKDSEKVNNTVSKLDAALGLDDSSVEGCIAKIKAIEKAIQNMQNALSSGNLSSRATNNIQAWMQIASESADEVRAKLSNLSLEEAGTNLQKQLEAPVKDFRKISEEADRLERALLKVKNAPNGMKKFGEDVETAERRVKRMRQALDTYNAGLKQINKSANFVGKAIRYAFPPFLIYKALGDFIKIRGEFELAEKSLTILLQDSAMARDIFGQIQKMAVKSPFQVSEMVTQTKQLAAFRVESDKLIETEKMLADISAGLGVDINRLILAYGQVKAATVLKGTELRQFSEAGVNMLGGLADRFTELQGKIVTTGDVLKMISKKMVTFGDVDAVLKKQTEAGGMFYKMQEQQAETLRGLISNMKDRMDIAFNEMGKRHDSTIKGMVKGLSSLIEHYRTFETIILAGVAGKALPGLFMMGTRGIKNITKSAVILFKSIGKIRDTFGTGIQGVSRFAIASAPILAAVTAISVVAVKLIKQANELDKTLKKINEEGVKNTKELERRYTSLANIVSNSTKSEKEKREAMETLRQEFGNIIPAIQKEGYEINKLTDAYNEHISAIRAYNNEKTRQDKLSAISGDIGDRMPKLTKQLTGFIKDSVIGSEVDVSRDVVETFIYEIIDEIKKGELRISEAADRFKEKFTEYYNIPNKLGTFADNEGVDVVSNFFSGYIHVWSVVIDRLKQFSDVKNQLFTDTQFGEAGQPIAQEIDKIKSIYEKKITELTDSVTGEYKNNLPKARIAAREYVKSLVDVGRVDLETGKIVPSFGDMIKNADITETQRSALEQKLTLALKGVYTSAGTEALEQAFSELNDTYSDILRKDGKTMLQFGVGELSMSENESIEAFKTRLISIREDWGKSLKTFNEDATQMQIDAWQMFADKLSNERAVELIDRLINETLRGIGEESKSTKTKGTSDYKSRLNAFVKEVRDAQKNLEELNEEGDALLIQKLQNMAKNLQIQLPPDLKSGKEIKEWIEQIKDKLGNDAYLDIQIELNREDTAKKIADIKDVIDSLWENFDLSLTLKDLGISSEQYDTTKILQELAAEEKRLRDINTEDSIRQADEVAKRRIANNRRVAEEAWREMKESQVKSMTEAEQAYTKMFESIKKIRSDANASDVQISQEQIDTSVQGAIAKGYKEIAEAEWEAYKGTEMYIKAFGDLEGLSSDVLRVLYKQLEDFSSFGNLDPSDAKAVASAMEKIKGEMGNGSEAKTYFGIMRDGFASIAEAKKQSKDLATELQAFSDAADVQAKAYQRLQEAMANVQKNDSTENKQELAEAEKDYAKSVEETSRSFDAYSKKAQLAHNAIQRVSTDAEKISAAFEGVESMMNGAIDLVTGFADAMGLSLGEDTTDAIDAFVKGFALIGTAITFVNTSLTATGALMDALAISTATVESLMAPLLIMAVAIGAVAAAIKISDNQKLNQIDAQKKKVEELTKAYEELEDAISSAFSISTVNKSFSQQLKNINEQRKAIERMIEIEKSRGAKASDDSLDEYNEQLEELTQKAKEANEARLEALGAKADYSSDAKSFTSAWLDAFKETGNGIDSLTENFNEMFDDVIAQQLNLRILGPYVKELQDKLQAILDDGIVTAKESSAFRQAKESIANTVNRQLSDLATSLGVAATGSVDKDTLQRGIENITESTAQVIEGILNSMRFFVADTNDRVAKIQSILFGEGDVTNPILNELQIQTGLIRSINSTITGVVKPNHSKGGMGLKVFAD